MRGDSEGVMRVLVEQEEDVGQLSFALGPAAQKGLHALVELLIKKGAHLNTKNDSGRTALHQAANNGHDSVVALLLRHDARLNEKDDEQLTALYRAAASGHDKVVRLLLEHERSFKSVIHSKAQSYTIPLPGDMKPFFECYLSMVEIF